MTLKSKKSAGNLNFKILCFRDYPLFFFFKFYFSNSLFWLCFVYIFNAYILVFSEFELSGAVPQEAPVDPCWDGSLDGGGDGIRGFFHRTHQRRHALQPFGLRTSLPAGH